ncbi:unnamed protein product [Rotaria magnacalcarata]|nr:unnamed protein product [Rotaria magnacalcarata]
MHDNVDIDDDGLFQHDSSPPLYERSNITTSETVTQLMKFCIKSNFDKQQVVKMMCLLKSILPTPNRLPTTFRQILNIYGKTPSSIENFYCNNCWTLIKKKGGQQICTNTNCLSYNLQLSKRQVTEVVTTNIREKVQSVVRRNLSLLTGNDNLFPPFDIPSGDRYQTITKEIDHPITLCIHADGAPLIRSTKSAVWPCFSSIVELPPPVREHKSNILTLGLWVSTVKPNVNLFLHDIIEQLIDLSKTGTSIFINEHEFRIHIKTQFFVSDLPAKSLFLKTINFNGYFACTKCFTEGVLYNRQVIYPYQSNNYQSRTHDDFVTIGKQVEKNLASGHKRGTSIAGVKGLSSLLKIFKYPDDIIFDYMHLICLNHVPNLIRRFVGILSKEAIIQVDNILSSTRLPHDMDVKFIYSIQSIQDWKAKHVRLFILHLALPILVQHLPVLYSSHFSIYCILVKLLHCPKTLDEIDLAKKLIHFYCRTSSKVYDPKIELYSLHAHIHLPSQVRSHGGLAFTSAFCFESMIHYIKKKAFGTKNLASQIMYWCDIESIIQTKQIELPFPCLINEMKFDSELFNGHRDLFTKAIFNLKQDLNSIKLYLRYKDKFLTYHSTLYSKRFSCTSYLISYLDAYKQIQYGNIILFYMLGDVQYSFIQKYRRNALKISNHLDIPDELKETVDSLYPICSLSDEFIIIHISEILTKCISVAFQQYQCISERRINYEHD